MLFRKWGCLVGPKNSIFRKLKSVDPKKKPLTTEMLLHFYFPFKAFPENERERERERARACERRSVRRRDRTVNRDLAFFARSRLTARSREGEIDASRDRVRRFGVRRRSSDWLECFFSSCAHSLSLSLSLSLSHFSEMLWRENISVKAFPSSKAFFLGQRISISGK